MNYTLQLLSFNNKATCFVWYMFPFSLSLSLSLSLCLFLRFYALFVHFCEFLSSLYVLPGGEGEKKKAKNELMSRGRIQSVPVLYIIYHGTRRTGIA